MTGYVEAIADRIQDESDRKLFFRLYEAKNPCTSCTAILIAVLLSPAVAYIYVGNWLSSLAYVVIAWALFTTPLGWGGLVIAAVLSLVTMPQVVEGRNTLLAEESYNEILLARPKKEV